MGFSKDRPITPFQKRLLDEYYANGLKSIEAYCTVKKIDVPKDRKKRMTISGIVSACKTANPDYIAKLHAKNDKLLGSMKERLIDQLENVSETYFELMRLAQQDSLTEAEEEKFKRLKSIMTTADLNKAVDILAKMTGSYEAEKVEVTNTFKVAWGEAPALKENNKPIIDVTDISHEEIDDEDE